ncbi:phosphatase PAP2 family protein [Peptoniphilus sp. oral taxon 386]|uniref:phosphatase PAP2 family protein n=1 Tax=Peptoniphilus sp. oral taxon 386 TaxID=652713 RepID=UPI0001DA99AE|nr:phosphatase PAP2 family protein [Peptoniphilus sp. oral taxon 386]EFI41736.1 PAP2 family protein [Peptoniphilus sp. oral taxon 386 str. F0131]
MELKILDMISTIRNPILDKIMIFISTLGNAGAIFIIIGLFLFIRKDTRRIGLTVLISLLFCLIFGNIILKPLIGRVRPYDANNVKIIVKHLKDASFPSGHTFSAVACAMSVSFYNRRYGRILFVFAALMAFSRMYLYLHYPTDILGGAVLGIFCALLSREVMKSDKLKKYREVN